MPDPEPNHDPQQPLPTDPAGPQLPLELRLSEELEGFAKKDVPAVPSSLLTHEEVAFELERESLRITQERRLAFTWTRRSFLLLIALMLLIALVSTAAVVVGLSRGEKEIVLPALGALSGAGAAGALLCRSYINRLNPKTDGEGPS